MRKVEISDYEEAWKFSIDRVKIIQGDNKYRLYKSLQHQMMKEDASEYESERNDQLEIKINGQKLDTKINKIYLLNLFTNFDDELKLSARSILVEYLESHLKDVDYQDEFIMLNQSIDLINQGIFEDLCIESNDSKMMFALQPFTLKTLIKSSIAELYKNELHANDYDLTLNEKMILFFTVLNRISLKNQSRNYIVLVVIDELTSIIYEELISSSNANLQYVVFVNDLHCVVNYQDLYVVGKIKMDFSDEESIYENLVIEKGIAQDLEDSKRILSDYCNNPRKTTKFSCYLAE